MRVILSLGSNIGDKHSFLSQAINLIKSKKLIYDLKFSKIYKTEPVGIADQDWFYNMAISGECNLSPIDLFNELKGIEIVIGRVHRQRWHQREIDIDIIFFDSLVINTDSLIIPHPRMQERNFVLFPVNEIQTNFIHPVLKKTVGKLLKESKDNSKVILLPENEYYIN